MLDSMSSMELAEWQQYDRIDPIGSARSDIQAATVALTVANYSGRTRRRLSVRDFIPVYDVRAQQREKTSELVGWLRKSARGEVNDG